MAIVLEHEQRTGTRKRNSCALVKTYPLVYGLAASPNCGKDYEKSKEMNWEEFVKDFVEEIDHDIAKDLDPATAEMSPEDVEEYLGKLVAVAKRLYEIHNKA